jgi:hypothetical protein
MAKKRSRRGRNRNYRYTAKRATALKRAQAISARKRKGRRVAIAKGVVTGATLAGVGAAAIYGYKNRSTIGSDIRSTKNRWRNAVQPGSKERVRIANAITGGVKKPTKKRPATKGAKTMTRTDLGKVNPNTVDPNRNNAFPKQQRDVEVANKLISGSDRPYNIDKFLPRGVKGLVHGKRVTGAAAGRAAKEHSKAKGAMGVAADDAAGILHDMVKDGEVSRVVYGKKVKKKAKYYNDPLMTPSNRRAGYTRRNNPKPTFMDKVMDQYIEDFE